MSQARDLLSLLSSADQVPPVPSLPVDSLTSTTVAKSANIPSVQAFHAQLVLGGKDAALRKSAAAFKSAADSMERVRLRGEKYWSDALRTRNDNWGLVPAPLPPGAPNGRGADKTTRDFWITFGLAECKLISQLRTHFIEDLKKRRSCSNEEQWLTWLFMTLKIPPCSSRFVKQHGCA